MWMIMSSTSKVTKKAMASSLRAPPRAKSTNSTPSKPVTRTLVKPPTAITTTKTTGLHKTLSDTSLVTRFKKLNVDTTSTTTVGRKVKPPLPGAGAARRYTSSSTNCKTVQDIVRLISQGKAKNVIIMAGAGISTPSGIPDFRTPGTGLYDNLQQYKIPYPEAIFDIGYFKYKPNPFFALAKELYPTGQWRPNEVHYLVRLLHEKGLLLRMYTQNIDGLERLAGIPAAKLVEAHGTFAKATCQRCQHSVSGDDIKDDVFKQKLPRCSKRGCNGILKPDIVFFGEDLPRRFYLYLSDFPQADLLIVMGTSLEVEPFASIVDSTRLYIPRLLINRDVVGPFKKRKRLNDVTSEGDLIKNVMSLVDQLGWTKELQDLQSQHEALATLAQSEDESAAVNGESDSISIAHEENVNQDDSKTSTNDKKPSDLAKGASGSKPNKNTGDKLTNANRPIRQHHSLATSNSVVRGNHDRPQVRNAVLPKIKSSSVPQYRTRDSSTSGSDDDTSDITSDSSGD